MKSTLVFFPLIFVHLASGQSVRIATNIAVSEAEYRNAEQIWLQNDPELVSDLYKAPRQDVVRRIHAAAALADDMIGKKATYMASLIEHTDEMEKRLSVVRATSDIPLADLKGDLEREQANILDEEGRLEERLHDLPQGDEMMLVRRAMEAEHGDLVLLQNNIAQRIRAMDNAATVQKASAALLNVDPIIGKLDDVKKMWTDEKARALSQKSAFDKMYSDMEKSLDSSERPSGSAPAALPQGSPAKTPPSRSPKQGASLPGPPVNAIFGGSWVYKSQPGAWIGFGEPEMVSLELHQIGPRFEGTYSASLPMRLETRSLNLSLEGQLGDDGEAQLQWTSLEPAAHGLMTVRLGPDNRLLVERVISDDNYIPRGMEVLVR
jgi:hypothetical protein